MHISGARILVTGAGGHLGGHIVEQLLRERPAQVIALDRGFPSDVWEVAKALRDPVVTQVKCDITDLKRVREMVKGIDVVVHTAAVLSRETSSDLRKAYDVNIGGTFGLIEASADAGVRKFVLSSSSSVYDGRSYDGPIKESAAFDPASLYGVGKATAEMLLRVFEKAMGLQYVALRCAAIYGVRQSRRSNSARVIPDAFASIERGMPPAIPGDGTQAYDFINVVDVARAHIKAISSAATGEAYNVATGILTPVADVVRRIANVTRTTLEPVRGVQEQRHLIPVHAFDVSKAEQDLGFKATLTLDVGLQSYYEWRESLRRARE